MANSRTLLVYVLALVVCGSSRSSFWVSANTVPVLKEPVAVLGASSPQHLQHQQQQRVQQQPLTAQHQQIQESPRTLPSYPSPSPAIPVAAQPQYPSHGTANNNNNNAPATYSVKNAWGLSAGNSDSGPYTAGYGYISGRTLQQPVNSPKSDYELMERPSRQLPHSLFAGMTPAIQAWFANGLDIKSMLVGGAATFAVTNLGMPDTISYLIPALRWLRGGPTTKESSEKEKKSTVPAKEVVSQNKQESEKVEQELPAPSKVEKVPKPVQPVQEAQEAQAPPKKEEIVTPVKDAPSNKEAVATTRRRKRDLSAQPDTDLTELATMVLTAIQSGECMQRSICILGSQIGASNKGRAAFTLVDKLIPESVQGNQYFVTLKKALRGGESFCDRFRCRIN